MKSVEVRKVLAKISRDGWNKTVLTNEDFDSWCARDGVFVTDTSLPGGAYMLAGEMPVIFLNRELTGVYRAITAWHEYGHFLFDAPEGEVFYFLRGRIKSEYQANLVAACALIPKPLLYKYTRADLFDHYGYPSELIDFRHRVFARHKF